MSDKKEVRSIQEKPGIETREDGSIGKIHGYAIVYNRDSEDMGFIEQIAPGAAKKAIKRSDIRALKNHDPSLIFGRQNVNLKLIEDERGLRYEAEPIDTANYREIAEEVRTGLLTGQSFGFTVLSDEWSGLDTDKPKRTITEIGEIFDVGPVTYPAYQDTTVALRSLDSAKEFPKENDGHIQISIDDGTDVKEYVFTGENRFDEAADKIKELRSSLNPKITDDDITEPDPKIEQGTDIGKDDLLEKIKQTAERYSK
jgi:HK97 family phage prohead protease